MAHLVPFFSFFFSFSFSSSFFGGKIGNEERKSKSQRYNRIWCSMLDAKCARLFLYVEKTSAPPTPIYRFC